MKRIHLAVPRESYLTANNVPFADDDIRAELALFPRAVPTKLRLGIQMSRPRVTIKGKINGSRDQRLDAVSAEGGNQCHQ